jgi:uncharacterized protein (DUF2237 family)
LLLSASTCRSIEMPAPPQWLDMFEPLDERVEVARRRYHEALDAGLSVAEANEFADSLADIGQLRKLVAAHCSHELIAAILL